ncbi:MAG: YrdB family protein [Chloroflexi bacterium]|nr:YrdB family protein [Chloroflexota bacterium]
MTALNLGLRFLLELKLLATLEYWGFQGNGGVLRWAVGIGAPLAAAVIWGLWIAPKANHRLADPLLLMVEVILFLLGVCALWFVGQHRAAVVFGILVLINLVLLTIWQRR